MEVRGLRPFYRTFRRANPRKQVHLQGITTSTLRCGERQSPLLWRCPVSRKNGGSHLPKGANPPSDSEKAAARTGGLLHLLFLALLGVGAVGVTFAAVLLSRAGPPPGMVWVPGREFTMGTDSELGWPDEKPAHRVRVDGFWMDATEVTNAQFRAFVEA